MERDAGTDRSGAARRRFARRLHLGRARPPARRAVAQHCRHFRNLGRRDERRRAGGRLDRRRSRRRAGALEQYWQRVSHAAAFSPLQRSPLDRLMGRWTLDTSPAYVAMDLMSRVLSPYDLNPLGFNPLRQVLAESIDFERLARSPIKLFITATQRADRPRAHLPQRRDHGRCAAGLGLPADHVPRGRDRRRGLLGRRLCRQSDHHAARARKRRARHHPGADQSGEAAGHAAHGAQRSSIGSTKSPSIRR